MMAGNRDHPGRWQVALAGTLTLFACLGLGRFALGTLLPAMVEPLGLSPARIGYLSTANFMGYLGAVLACGLSGRRPPRRWLISLALVLVGGSMVSVGYANGLGPILILYGLTGAGSGLANVPTMTLVASWFGRRQRGRATGLVVSGSGLAIMVTGALVPRLQATGGEEGWRLPWLVLGGAVLVAALVAALVMREPPALPAADDAPPRGLAGQTAARSLTGTVLRLGTIYFLFGFTYVIYATFFVVTLVQERGLPATEAGHLWSWVGMLSLPSGPVLGALSDRIGRRRALALVFASQTAAYLLMAGGGPGAGLWLSVACYGLVAWSIPSIISALVADLVAPTRATRVFGLVTFIFAGGQVTGPALAGLLAEATGSYAAAFWLAGGLTALATGLVSRLPPPPAGPVPAGGGSTRITVTDR
ncbi:MAG: MFS transporter [Thermodesulfobacteriota bacterium]